MNQIVVVVIDGTRARFFTLEQPRWPEDESSVTLIEHKDLLNPVNELQGKELWSNVKAGRNQSSGGFAHAYDDGRQKHVAEFERRFAQMIADEAINLTQTKGTQQLILVAEPRNLGIVRESVTPAIPKNIQVQELAKDLSKLKALEIHEYLASKNLLPARQKISG